MLNIHRRSISKSQKIDPTVDCKIKPPLMFTFPTIEHENPLIKIKQCTKEVEWNLYFKEHGKGVSMYKTKELVKMVLVGIPESLRSNLWLTFSGMLIFLLSTLSKNLHVNISSFKNLFVKNVWVNLISTLKVFVM